MCQHSGVLVNCVCAAGVSRRLTGGDLLLPQMASARITCHDNPFYSGREVSTFFDRTHWHHHHLLEVKSLQQGASFRILAIEAGGVSEEWNFTARWGQVSSTSDSGRFRDASTQRLTIGTQYWSNRKEESRYFNASRGPSGSTRPRTEIFFFCRYNV